MYLKKYKTIALFIVLITILACTKEEENKFCNESIMESRAESFEFCETHSFQDDTILISSLLIEKDSLSDRVSTIELGLKLAGTFFFEQPKYKLVLYAQLSEDLDSLLIIENLEGTFTDDLDWVGHTNFCMPKKRGTLDLSPNIDSTIFSSSLSYDINCYSKSVIFKFQNNGYDYKLWGEFYE